MFPITCELSANLIFLPHLSNIKWKYVLLVVGNKNGSNEVVIYQLKNSLKIIAYNKTKLNAGNLLSYAKCV